MEGFVKYVTLMVIIGLAASSVRAEREPVCPPNNPENQEPPSYHPHESDCTKYYVCDNGVAQLMQCPDDLHWNQELEVCDFPQNAGCKALRVPPVCPPQGEGDDAIYFPHPTDCSKYYECANQVPVVMDCPPGLHWNPKLEVCDFPQNAGCTSS